MGNWLEGWLFLKMILRLSIHINRWRTFQILPQNVYIKVYRIYFLVLENEIHRFCLIMSLYEGLYLFGSILKR